MPTGARTRIRGRGGEEGKTTTHWKDRNFTDVIRGKYFTARRSKHVHRIHGIINTCSFLNCKLSEMSEIMWWNMFTRENTNIYDSSQVYIVPKLNQYRNNYSFKCFWWSLTSSIHVFIYQVLLYLSKIYHFVILHILIIIVIFNLFLKHFMAYTSSLLLIALQIFSYPQHWVAFWVTWYIWT